MGRLWRRAFAVFATKSSLIGAYEESHDAGLAERYQLPVPFSSLKFDLGLMLA